MSKPLDHWNYRNGLRTGYSEYRYGEEVGARPVYDPRNRAKPIFNKDKRRHLVEVAKGVLAGWQQSPFQYEGTVRAALRSALCLQGYTWHVSDAQADDIVCSALREMHVVRPTYAQGQKEYSVPRDYCAHCYASLDDEQIAGGHRFCSDGCKRIAIGDGWARDSLAMRRAWQQTSRAIRKENSDERDCNHCGKKFKSDRADASYCSRRCYQEWQAVQCLTKECLMCGAEFTAQLGIAKFCGPACTEGYGRMNRGLFPKSLTLKAFDYLLTIPINASRPKWLTPERFDEMMAA